MTTPPYPGTIDRSPLRAIWHNLRHFPTDLSVASFTAGLLIVLIVCTGPVVIILETAAAGHYTLGETSSWLFAAWLTSGLFTLYMSLRWGLPLIGATSTPSTVLLATGLLTHNLHEAVAAFLVMSVALIVLGATGFMSTFMKWIPHQVVMAMLAGVLFSFGVDIFTHFSEQPLIVGVMILIYFIARLLRSRAAVLYVFVAGVLGSILVAHSHLAVTWHLTTPVVVTPHFTVGAVVALALPMLLLTVTTQFAPGAAILTSADYVPPTRQALIVAGLISLPTSLWLNSGINSAAITASLATGEQAGPDPRKRYTAGVVCGVLYVAVAFGALSIVQFFSHFPPAVMAALAGLGLLPAITSSLNESLTHSSERDAAVITILVTVSGIQPAHLGAPFWGLCAGLAVHGVQRLGARITVK